MEIRWTCRICLARDLRMHLIINTHLQEIYEQLTGMPFEREDGRPLLACYICRARLQSCYDMKRDCLRTEEYLTNILNKQFTSNQLPEKSFKRLDMSRTNQMNIPDYIPNSLEVETKLEHTEMPAGVRIKQEIVEECKDVEIALENVVVKEETVDVKQDIEDDGEDTTMNKGDDDDGMKKTSFKVQERDPPNLSSLPIKATFKRCKNVAYDRWTVDETMTYNLNVNIPNDTLTEEKPYKCDMCGKCFTQKSYLSRHALIHTNKDRYKCDICKKCFSLKQNLDFHVRIHTGEKPHKCNICEKYFNHQSNLLKHVRKHGGEKIHKCDICKKCFNEKHHLTNHIRIHTGEKPYKCNICEKHFKSKSNLINHVRTHTGEKPHRCEICDKHFNKRSNLINHVRIHTGEKPYKCHICEQSFRQKGKYNFHIRKHT